MAEYIEREAAIAKIREEGVYGSGYSDEEREDNVVDMITSIHAADVRPVVRGKWEPVVAANEDGSPYQAGIHCSECGHFDVWEFNYCPNCGARMEES